MRICHCARCQGTGAEPSAKTMPPFNRCLDCDGRGTLLVVAR